MKGRSARLWLTAFAALTTLAFASPAQGAQQIVGFQTDASTSLAGGHPDLETSFELGAPGEPEVAKNVVVNLPAGVYGNPSVVSQCTSADFSLDRCPANAQVGVITIRARHAGNPDFLLGTAPIYSVDPGSEEAARFAFVAPTIDVPVAIPVTTRAATDYGLRFAVSGITQLSPLAAADLVFWGFPAAEAHDAQRFPKGSPGSPAGCPGAADTSCLSAPLSSSLPVRPLTGNPSTCSGLELEATLDVESYQRPGELAHAASSFPAITDCDRQTFNPGAVGSLTTGEADSPSGLDLEIKAPQTLGFAASPSPIRTVNLRLPPELTINPDAADGQTACSDADAKIASEGPSQCPDGAKIGTIVIGSTALPGDLTGSIYFAEPKPGDQYRLLMIADGFGIHAKLIGDLQPDPETGQLTVRFENLPQLPFDLFGVHLFASDRGVLATPTHCTIHDVETRIFPWNQTIADQTSGFGVSVATGPGGGACAPQVREFDPRLVAGTSNARAGDYSAFTLKLDRDDGDQYLRDLNFTLPPGLTGYLRGITDCPEGAIAAAAVRPGRDELAQPSCPSTSLVGTTNVAAGPGSHPFHAVGRMYLAGPFKGAPLSLVAITPALAGPYDYGVVVVRVALDVDPLDAHVTAHSDTVPSIIGGVPIRMRSIQVNIDRPSFTINPTNCNQFTVASQGIGDQGTLVDFSSYFQAVDCASLPFKPKMTVRLSNRGAKRRATNPALTFDLTTRNGDANLKSLSVTLSKAFSIDQRHLSNLCSERELAATQCAGRTAIGRASTDTPLLDQPLSGPVYAVSGSGGLPRLAFLLDGEVDLLPRAETRSVKERLQTTVPVVPDAPIGHFRMTVFGGSHGYLINTRSLCAKGGVSSTAEFDAQNGKTWTQKMRLKVACPSRRKSHP